MHLCVNQFKLVSLSGGILAHCKNVKYLISAQIYGPFKHKRITLTQKAFELQTSERLGLKEPEQVHSQNLFGLRLDHNAY